MLGETEIQNKCHYANDIKPLFYLEYKVETPNASFEPSAAMGYYGLLFPSDDSEKKN
jgi:hypothetical protein